MEQSDDVPDINLLYEKLMELRNLIINQDALLVSQYIKDTPITPDVYKLLPWYTQNGIYPTEIATDVGDVDILSMLLTQGFSPLGLKANPIYTACKNGNVSIVKLLIEHGADVAGASIQTDPPHCSAIEYGQCEVVKILIEAGASVNTSSPACQYTFPLNHAASVGANGICRYLISVGAEVDSRDHKNRTPLFQAARHHKEEACQVLLDAGADVDSRSCSGLTPFLAAVSTFYNPLENNQERLKVMKILVSRGTDPDSVDMFGCSALHYAIHSYDVTRYLVDNNVTLDKRNDCKDSTPFTLAMLKKYFDVATLLVEAGYNPSGEKCVEALDIPTEIAEYIRTVVSNPKTLQDICCFRIRNIFGKTFCNVIQTLPLPKTVRDFVMLRHLPLMK